MISVTSAAFRRLALSLPEASEAAHMGHPDFRVRNKIFATLGSPDGGWGTVKLTPEQQGVLVEAEPAAFKPAAGAWGRRGDPRPPRRRGRRNAQERTRHGLAQYGAEDPGGREHRIARCSPLPDQAPRTNLRDRRDGTGSDPSHRPTRGISMLLARGLTPWPAPLAQKIRSTGRPNAMAPAYSACGPDCSG